MVAVVVDFRRDLRRQLEDWCRPIDVGKFGPGAGRMISGVSAVARPRGNATPGSA